MPLIPLARLNILASEQRQGSEEQRVVLQAKEACYLKDAMERVKGHLQAGQIKTAIEIINIHIQHL